MTTNFRLALSSRPLLTTLALLLPTLAGSPLSTTIAQPSAPTPPAIVESAPVNPVNASAVAAKVWAAAKANDLRGIIAAGNQLPKDSADPFVSLLANQFAIFKQNLDARESLRESEITKVSAKLDELMTKDRSALNLSKALKEAVELHMLTREDQKETILSSPRMNSLITAAAQAARQAEADGQWLMANELFGRLNLLLEEQATFKQDAKRLIDRLGMLRLYAPSKFYEMRNQRTLLDGKKALPPYNPIGQNYADRLRGITLSAVLRAVDDAGSKHVERVTVREMLVGGLTSVKTMASTHDLQDTFPGLKDDPAVRAFTTLLDKHIAEFSKPTTMANTETVRQVLGEVIVNAGETVKIPREALLHEFGNGAFEKLDEFSAIIWPDEKQRFDRMVGGDFIGIGIQIQIDEESQLIKVVQPLEGTPAWRIGVQAGDFIKKINDISAVGMSLDQAIEQITGPRGTKVNMTFDRGGQEIVYTIARDRIPIVTTKGWKRTGNGDKDWDYMIDRQAGIGYVRLSGFNAKTTDELHDAIDAMNASGVPLRGIILDLRFNPGGLLNQAVGVANTFVADGTIVYTKNASGVREQTESAEPAGRIVGKDIPVVVMINDGSASASEIVSGAIRHYAKVGAINAVVLGSRSFGKGSVQNVYGLTRDQQTQMKLTTQYYYLPDDSIIHRRPGAKTWGVEPNLTVDMLPRQISDSLTLRIDADTTPEGRIVRKPVDGEEPIGEPNPDRLLNEPRFDLQLQAAVNILRAQAVARQSATAAKPDATGG